MKKHKEPIFFSNLLFDFLEINEMERLTMKSRVEYLKMTLEEISWRFRDSIMYKEGLFLEEFPYMQFYLPDDVFLFLFNDDGLCFRAYSYRNILPN